MQNVKRSILLKLAAAVLVAALGGALAAPTRQPSALADQLRCGVKDGRPGLAESSLRGRWRGADVELCRAVAQLLFGDPAKAVFVDIDPAKAPDALRAGEIDIALSTSNGSTGPRHGGLTLALVSGENGQGFLVRRALGMRTAADLKAPTICLMGDVEAENRVGAFFRGRGIPHLIWTFVAYEDMHDAYAEGRCDAVSGPVSELADDLAGFAAPGAHFVLPDLLSSDPAGPVLRADDSELIDAVRRVGGQREDWIGSRARQRGD